jgi:hypothetical protein
VLSISSSIENQSNDPNKIKNLDKKGAGGLRHIPRAQQTKENSINQEIISNSNKSDKKIENKESKDIRDRDIKEIKDNPINPINSDNSPQNLQKSSTNIKQNLSTKFEEVALGSQPRPQSPFRSSRTKNFSSPRKLREIETGDTKSQLTNQFQMNNEAEKQITSPTLNKKDIQNLTELSPSQRQQALQYNSSPQQNYNSVSNSKDKISIKEGVDFTFKKSIIDNRSENPITGNHSYTVNKASTSHQYSSYPHQGSDNQILEYLRERDNFKHSVATASNPNVEMKLENPYLPNEKKVSDFTQSINKDKEFYKERDESNSNNVLIKIIEKNDSNQKLINNQVSNNNVIVSSHSSLNRSPTSKISPFPNTQNIDKLIKLTPLNLTEENFIIEDEFCINERQSIHSDAQSVISSNVLSHINTPKMFNGIKSSSDNSYIYSNFSKSEISRLETNKDYLLTENHTLTPNYHSEDMEYEITNENSERLNKFIETPKSSNLMFSNYSMTNMKNSNSYQNLQSGGGLTNLTSSAGNPQLKDLTDRLSRKERETKKLNEKIQKLVTDLHRMEEESKRYERKIEKEEAEGEMLKHMLNFLMSNA